MNNEKAMNWQFFPQIRGMHAIKTGPYEIQVKHPLKEHLEGAMRLLNSVMIAPEVYEQYEDDSLYDWRYDVGNGPYIIVDIVAANTVTLEKNPNYWMTDPIGPGMGNQLPYIDKLKYIIIQDLSTRQAAARTGKIDQMIGLTLEDKNLMTNQTPELMAAEGTIGLIAPMFMRTDLEPFSDKNVRRALMVATDFNEINEGLYSGLGDIVSWPYYYTPEYADLYLGLDDPECPESVKELYTYNPDKARQLLSDAGYPTGFKTSVVISGQDVADYYSIVKDQWSKVGIDLEIMQVADVGALIGTAASVSYEGLISIFFSPPFTYPEQAQYCTGTGWLNASLISDPYIDEQAEKAKEVGITDFRAAMAITKELMKYVLDQAYCIPTPAYPNYVLWWPWLKNYSGELSVGYAPGDSWVQYVWIDQDLKKEMGY
jgi:peptide/nickel transport system substrate-binding protein